SFNATLTGVTIVVNSNTSGGGAESVNFFNTTFDDGLGFQGNAALGGYQLATDVGPITGSGGALTPTNGLGNFSTTGLEFGRLEQSVDPSLPFRAARAATPSAVPEPASMLLLATGLAGVGARRWRNRGQRR